MDERAVTRLLADQHGTISRRQVEGLDGTKADLDRLLRRKDLVRLLPGVYVDHTGDPTWLQRASAGVLYAAPAALGYRSAIRAAAGPGWRRHRDSDAIHLAISDSRRLRPIDGYVLHRTRGLEDRVQWNVRPPRMRFEEAALDVAAASADDFEAVGLLADVVQSRRTTAARLLTRLESRTRLRNRDWLRSVLDDVAQGSCSVLEFRYLTRVEEAHGLPCGERQVDAVGERGAIQRDVLYRDHGLVVELDGRLFHDTAGQRDLDFERDLDSALEGKDTVRLSWGQVVDRPCRTAWKLGRLLRQRGWTGPPRPCGPDCTGIRS